MLQRGSNSKVSWVILGMLLFLGLLVMRVFAGANQGEMIYLPLISNKYPPPPSSTVKLLITEVLYNPLTEPNGEWVEIYNPSEGTAILSAYKIGDEENLGYEEGMLQFPPGAMLAAGGVVVVANRGAIFRDFYGFPPDFEMYDSDPQILDMLSYHAWSSGKVELVNGGDEFLLLDGEDSLIDAVSWGGSTFAFDPVPSPAGDGQSLERSPAYNDSDSAADWLVAATPQPYQLDLSTPTPTASPTPIIPTGPTILLVSEVLYDPSGDDPAGEWIELYNAGENNAALWLYRLGDEETQGAGEGMYFFPAGAILFSGETAVIARDALTFELLHGFKADFEISGSDPAVPDMLKDSTWANGSLNLSASGDEVLLLDENDQLVDGVSWGSSTLMLDPSVPGVDPDHSIERYPPENDTDSATDWRAQPNPLPGEIDLTEPTATPIPTDTPVPTETPVPTPLPTLIINEIHADPADDLSGDANGDGVRDQYDDEFVELVNTTSTEIDLGGWTISDLTGIRHTFSVSTTLSAGEAIVIFGGGTPTGDFGGAVVQIASSGTLGLNNTGDTLTLKDANDILVDSHQYGSSAGDNQSLTRDPDISGPDPMVKHSLASGSDSALFSPGTRIDGTAFTGGAIKTAHKLSASSWKH